MFCFSQGHPTTCFLGNICSELCRMPTILDTLKTAENLVAPIDYKVGTVEEKRWKKWRTRNIYISELTLSLETNNNMWYYKNINSLRSPLYSPPTKFLLLSLKEDFCK